MSVFMAQAKIKTEHVPELRPAAARLFTAIEAAQPEGIRYAWTMLADGQTFVALVEVDDGVENPIPALPEYQELQARVEDWIAEPPTSQPMTVIGSYRLF